MNRGSSVSRSTYWLNFWETTYQRALPSKLVSLKRFHIHEELLVLLVRVCLGILLEAGLLSSHGWIDKSGDGDTIMKWLLSVWIWLTHMAGSRDARKAHGVS